LVARLGQAGAEVLAEEAAAAEDAYRVLCHGFTRFLLFHTFG
jgi:hypothetical protein